MDLWSRTSRTTIRTWVLPMALELAAAAAHKDKINLG